jgi:hypothetical protein
VIAFFDESGSDERARVFVLACVLAPSDATWATVCGAWKELLEAWGLPEIHMADLEATPRRGPYAKLSDEDVRRVKDRIAAIILPLQLRMFSCGFLMTECRVVLERIRKHGRRRYLVENAT